MELNAENRKVVMNKSESEISKLSHYSCKKFEEKGCKFCSRNHCMVKSECPAWANPVILVINLTILQVLKCAKVVSLMWNMTSRTLSLRVLPTPRQVTKLLLSQANVVNMLKKTVHMVDDESSDSSTEGSVSVITDGLIFIGERLVIPKELRKSVLSELHVGHTGIDGSLRRACEIVYWPGMTNDAPEHTQKCETCREFEHSQAKEPLMNHELPSRSWQKVGADLLHVNKKDSLVTVDYYWNFWETDCMTLCQRLWFRKWRHTSQDIGPQFVSLSFLHFTIKYDIQHITSSPHHPRSKGKAESAVKAAKRILKKTLKQEKTRIWQY